MKNLLNISLLVALTALLATSCKPKGDFTGRIFMPDMTYSNAYEAYASTKFQNQSDTDAISAILPVNGTIPRGYLPQGEEDRKDDAVMMSYLFSQYFENPLENRSLVDADERARAKSMLTNPYQRTPEVLDEGEGLYTTYCAVCHGPEGQGMGSIVVLEDGSDGPYSAIPPSYESRLPGLSDGEIYYSIAYGKNMMGGYYSQISADDRWKLVHYIKDMAGIEESASSNVDGGEDGMASEMEMKEFAIEDITVEAGTEIDIPNIYYNIGSSELMTKSYETLDKLVAFFDENSNVKVEIGAHADKTGDPDKNMVLSAYRANTVANYLIANGVAADQIIAKGYGSELPAVDCDPCTAEQHQQNRRTSFKILEVN